MNEETETPETIAAILAEMREYDNTPPPQRAWLDLADRIEAAYKREREAAQSARDMRDAMDYAATAERPAFVGVDLAKDKPTHTCVEIAPGNAGAREAWKKICAACAEGTPPERCVYYGEPNGCNAPTLGKHPEGDLAERLQEELEKAERRIAELESAPGNAASMREALESLITVADCFRGLVIDSGALNGDAPLMRRAKMFALDMSAQFGNARAALAAPARNCDRFATANEALKAYIDWQTDPVLAGAFAWLFAPAEGGNHA